MQKTNRTDSKIVREIIQEHIKAHYEDLEDLRADMEALKYGGRTTYQAASEMVKGGCFLIYTYSINEFIESLNLNNNSNRKFDDIETFNLYVHLVAREIEKMLKPKK